MKSFTALAISVALVSAVTAQPYGGGKGNTSSPPASVPGMQIETKPPVVVVQTITLTKTWSAHPSGKPHWKQNNHKIQDNDEDEDNIDEVDGEVDGEEDGGDKWNKADDLHANSLASADFKELDIGAAEVSELAENLAAAQASVSTTLKPFASKSSVIASKASSTATSAASVSAKAAKATSAGDNIRVSGTFVATAAVIAAYLLL